MRKFEAARVKAVANENKKATAFVHEVWLRLVSNRPVSWSSQAQFFAVAVEAMRRILIDHARKKGATKRSSRPSSTPSLSARIIVARLPPQWSQR